MTKIQFWKQFTTRNQEPRHNAKLYSVWQRYNFESNLQRHIRCTLTTWCCIQYDKDTILKAIYNEPAVVCENPQLYSVWQRYNFESNLQPYHRSNSISLCCIQYDKDTILKAIYNDEAREKEFGSLYSVWQRYNFESNLQQVRLECFDWFRCIQYDKDTILKAIYNLYRLGSFKGMLYSVWQRYNFESNLQRYEKDLSRSNAVFSMTKIQFWKQFTTIAMLCTTVLVLYSVWQRYNFESNLQLNDFADQQQQAVFSMTKIQFWKQFITTGGGGKIRPRWNLRKIT